MKTHTSPSCNSWKKLIDSSLLSLVIINLFLISGCPPSSDEDTWQIRDDGIVSTWILKNAEFRQEVDLDGPGNMMPITDAKYVIFDLFDVYNNCSSIDEIPFQFTDEPALDEDLKDFMGSSVYSAKAVCPEGQGVTSWIFDYFFSPNNGTEYNPILYLFKKEILDPGQLFDWQGGIKLEITHSEVINGTYTISGHLYGNSLVSSLPDPKPDLTFDFIMERIDSY